MPRDGHCFILWASVYWKQWLFIKSVNPCVRTNWFLAVILQCIWNFVIHRTRGDCYGCRYMNKAGWERSQAVERGLFWWTDARRTWWFPFDGITRSGRVVRKGPDNETWSCCVCGCVHVGVSIIMSLQVRLYHVHLQYTCFIDKNFVFVLKDSFAFVCFFPLMSKCEGEKKEEKIEWHQWYEVLAI